MNYSDEETQKINDDELRRSSSLPYKLSPKEIARLNQRGKNEAVGRPIDEEVNANEGAGGPSLPSLGGLNSKEEGNEDSKIDGKKDGDSKSEGKAKGKGKDKEGISKKGKEELKSKTKNAAASKAAKTAAKGSKFIGIKIYLIAIAVVLVIAAAVILYNSMFTAIISFSGKEEIDYNSDGDALLKEENYMNEDGTPKTLDQLVDEIKAEDNCDLNSLWATFTDNWAALWGNDFKDACGIIRFIRNTSKAFEERYNVNVDEGLVIAALFYGYDEQPLDSDYENIEDIAESDKFLSASNHYEVLENLAADGKLKRAHVTRIIKSTIYEEIYPYWTFVIMPPDPETGKTVGVCEYTEVKRYYGAHYANDNAPSYTRFKLFMRYNDNYTEDTNLLGGNKISEDRDGFSVSGILQVYGSDTLDIGPNSIDARNITGSGYVYDTNLNSAWEATSEECNGTMTEEEIKAATGVSSVSFNGSNTFFTSRKITGPIDTAFYEQYVDDPYAEKTYTFESQERLHTTRSTKSGARTTLVEMDYRKGYAYQEFPSFKDADENPNLPNYQYSAFSTNKKIEILIENMMQRREDFNEILKLDGSDSNTLGSYNLQMNYGAEGQYCNSYLNASLDTLQVRIVDCQKNYIETVSLKDYIVGVAYAEVDSMVRDYVLTQMVASLSFALEGRDYQSGTITIRSGSCQQNFCNPTTGCKRLKDGKNGGDYSTVREDHVQSKYGERNYWKRVMPAEKRQLYEELFAIASGYLIINPKNGKIVEAHYSATTHNKWLAAANAGQDFLQILEEQYSDYQIVDCITLGSVADLTGSQGQFTDVTVDIAPPTASQKVWGELIANKAMSILKNNNDKFCYLSGHNSIRVATYNDILTDGYLKTDCNGFVGYVVHHALGIGPDVGTSLSNITIAGPSSTTWNLRPYYEGCFKKVGTFGSLSSVLSAAEKGDLIASVGDGSTHIQIYYGDGIVIDNGNHQRRGCNGVLASRSVDGSNADNTIRHQKAGNWSLFRIQSLSCAGEK